MTSFTIPSVAKRPVLGRRPAFGLVGAVMGILLFAAAAPSPLYVVYQARWHFSTTTLTAVFAAYALAVLGALIAFGSLSDQLGRRPVLLAALLTEAVAMVLFATAGGVGWLFAARITQGVATGVATGVISAALLDFEPEDRPGLGALANTVSLSAGLAAGAVVTGALAQYAPAPTVLVYAVLAATVLVATAGTVALPEPVPAAWKGWRQALRPRRAAVPAPIRRPFAAASGGLVAAFAISGLFLSLGPSLTAMVFRSPSHLVDALAIGVLFGAGAAIQPTLGRWPARRAVIAGAAAMVAGLAVTDWGVLAPSAPAFLAGTLVAGAGFGLSVKGGFATITELASPDRRAEVTSAAYVVVYLSLSVPAVLAGLATTQFGLRPTTIAFSVIAAVLAATGFAAGYRYAPSPDHEQEACS